MQKKIRCFVAMAFGRSDTDKFYKQFETRFKDRLDIRRVDRINHNDDIDNKIFDELNQADLVVADLTHARPSVYFEAGYAAGKGVPVIYTSRADHISTRQVKVVAKELADVKCDDGLKEIIESTLVDSRRVHFDLLMKNIIGWKRHTDQAFWEAFGERLNLITTPILSRRAIDIGKRFRTQHFLAISLTRRLEELRKAAHSFFLSAHFTQSSIDENVFFRRAVGPEGKALDMTRVIVTDAVNARLLKDIHRQYRNAFKLPLEILRNIEAAFLQAEIIVISLNKVPASKLTAVHQDAAIDQKLKQALYPLNAWVLQEPRGQYARFEHQEYQVEPDTALEEFKRWMQRRNPDMHGCIGGLTVRFIPSITDPQDVAIELGRTIADWKPA